MKEQPAHPRAVLIFCSFFSLVSPPSPPVLRAAQHLSSYSTLHSSRAPRNVDAGGGRDAFPGCGALGWAVWRSNKKQMRFGRMPPGAQHQGARRTETGNYQNFLSNCAGSCRTASVFYDGSPRPSHAPQPGKASRPPEASQPSVESHYSSAASIAAVSIINFTLPSISLAFPL